MENELKSALESKLLEKGIVPKQADYLSNKLLKFNYLATILLERISKYGESIKNNKPGFYAKAFDSISNYNFPESADYISKRLFSSTDADIEKKLNVIGNSTVSGYVNLLDIAYKRSHGVEFIEKLLSSDKINLNLAKKLIAEDVDKRGIRGVLPKELYFSIF